jgi:galactokinase/mevalonate kinase-like predicted kinase
MENQEETREDLIIQIKHLISITGEEVEINPKFLEYFQYDELVEIRNNLEDKKTHQDKITNDYLDELYEKHIK